MDIDFESIYRSALSYARRHGKSDDAEDFAQECVIYALNNRTDAVFVARRFSDYLRCNYGRTGTPGGDVKRRATTKFKEFDEQHFGTESSDGPDFIEARRYLVGISRYEKLIYVLHHKHGIPQDTLADSQGVSPSRISQILVRIQKTINKNVKSEECGISRLRKTALETLLREEKGNDVERPENQGLEGCESFSLESFNEEGL